MTERLGIEDKAEPPTAEADTPSMADDPAAAFLARPDLGRIMLEALAAGARKAALDNQAIREGVVVKA